KDAGWQPPKHLPPTNSTVNPELVAAIAERLRQLRHKERGEWINCSCVYPERHSNGDKHPSFGFNTASGYAFCYRCGTILAKDLCERLGIDPREHGGLIKKPEPVLSLGQAVIVEPPVSSPPPANLPPLSGIELPDWLREYTGWASRVGNQTPVTFHQAAGIWLLAVAIARRLYVEAPWGIKLYPNMYMMFVADTTFYRKTTAYKLAESVIRQAIPHMLMPTPGSPERFQDALAGRLPSNYRELTYEQQELFSQARAFAAQRGLFKDEVAGLFGAFNKKDYMFGLKDLIMELYDCPDYSDKDTQTGLTIVKDAALSILGVTTPAGLSAAISPADWDNGLLPRFALLTPEPDYLERPTLKAYEPAPISIINGLKSLYEQLPMPQQAGDGWTPAEALRIETSCWDRVEAYSNRLRELCDPHRETPLDDRLKGLYGRMHVQSIKLAMIFAALDWMKSDAPAPIITQENWQTAEKVAEHWRMGAHRLLESLDRSGAGREERCQQDRVLDAVRGAGPAGITLRKMYRNLNLRSADARQIVQELQRDGQIVLKMFGNAEGCVASEYVGVS
ncbi:MAG: DUF3987 domain-containing protein, partial [Anaerolineae bacterium]|nr:DUF3987 domain-containing protein [Anaerolineae bacterium]